MIDKNMIHDSDFNKLQELGFLINGELTDEYISIYKLYNNYLLHHIDSLIGLSSYIEDSMLSREPTIKPVEKELEDPFQKLSYLNYFFIRNSLKIERLPNDVIQILKERINSGKTQFDEEANKLVMKTIINVIKNETVKDGVFINYGFPYNSDVFAPNNAVVLGMRVDIISDTEDDEHFIDNYIKKREKVNKVKSFISDEMNKYYPIPFKLIEYDDSSDDYSISDVKESTNKK